MTLAITMVCKDFNQPMIVDEALKQIANIEQVIFPNDAWSVVQFTQLLDNPINQLMMVTDESNQQIIGYCLYQQLFEAAEIFKIGTAATYQQQGIASQLLASLIHTLQQQAVQRIMLEVREDNQPAILLYQKHGFEQIFLRKNYYTNLDNTKTHALILQKKLVSLDH